MCVTLGPAKLSDTIIYAHRMADGRHVLGYQNKANSNKPDRYSVSAYNPIRTSFPKATTNAMILPIPSQEEMGPENAVDLRADKMVLKAYAATVSVHIESKSGSRGMAASLNSVSVFKTGSYEVVMARRPELIPNVVKELYPDVPLNQDLLGTYAKLYRGWNVAVCFWSGDVEPEPIMFTYEPKFKNHLFAPTLDSHTGSVPPDTAVYDHTLVFGAYVEKGLRVRRETPASLKPYFASHVVGFNLNYSAPNGDTWFPIAYQNIGPEWAGSASTRLPAGLNPA